jgi:hypothetical protein
MVYITKTLYYEVSCGVVVGWVLKVTWTGVLILQARFLQARCVSCRVSLSTNCAIADGCDRAGGGGGGRG